jgi:membrane-associated PAP2 superfamily phosphatase
VTGLLFGLYPQLDLAVARHFHDYIDPSHNAFAWRISSPLMLARNIGLWVGTVLIAPSVAALIVKLIMPQRKMFVSGRAIVFLIATLVLAPGLMVNVLLKDHWHRPRPIDVAQFGGDQHFVPWWDPRGDCPNNCAFVSGDVAGAFWTIAPAALAPPQWRMLAYGAALALGTGMAAIRVMAGAHFVSDVVFAGIFTFLIIWIAHGLIYRWPRTRLSDEKIEDAVGRAGLAWRAALAWLGYRTANEIAGPEAGEGDDDKFKRRERGWW